MVLVVGRESACWPSSSVSGPHTPLFRLFYALVPGIKNFRAPSMMLFWLVNALFLMSAQTLLILFREAPAFNPQQKAKLAKKLLIAGFGTSGALLLCATASTAVFGVWNAFVDAGSIGNISRQSANASAFAQGALASAVLVAVLTWGVWKLCLQSSRPGLFSCLLLAVVCLDLYWRNGHFLESHEPDRFFPQETAVDFLQGQKEPMRVFGLPGAYDRSYLQYFKIETADGFVDNENRIYRAFRGGDHQRNPNFMMRLNQNPDGSVSGNPFLDLLNVKYLAFRIPGQPGLRLAENRSALPRAWFLESWEGRPDSLILDALKDPAFDPKRFAYVSTDTPVPGIHSRALPAASDDGAAIQGPPTAVISGQTRSYNSRTYEVANPMSGLLVLSEVYIPHWKVRVDGQPAPLLRVDYALQGVALPAGTHKIEFRYQSPWISRSLVVSGLSLFILIAGLTGFSLAGRAALRKK